MLFFQPTAQVVPNIPCPQMPPPFGIKYHFTLACRKCFNKIKEGHEGYVYKERLPHQCLLDILLVKDKTDPEAKWVKIRPRPNVSLLSIVTVKNLTFWNAFWEKLQTQK